MSQNYKTTGVKISQYPHASTNKGTLNNRLEHEHYLMSYAATNYGISEIRKNYQIPMTTLRKDMLGYIGLQNIKPSWRNYIMFWEGDWNNEEDKTQSYIYEWKDNQFGNVDYIYNKHGKEASDDEIQHNRVFILRTAPWPLEAKHDVNCLCGPNGSCIAGTSYGSDPNKNTTKLVTKNYIDDRFNGIRKVKISGTELKIRPYSCRYIFDSIPETINITDTEDAKYDSMQGAEDDYIKNKLQYNCVEFYLEIPKPNNVFSITANNNDNLVIWSNPHELENIISSAIKNEKKTILIKCFAEYKNEKFTITCSDGLSYGVSETVDEGSTLPPSSDAVYDFVKGEISKVQTSQGVNSVTGDDFINTNDSTNVEIKLGLNVSTKIVEDANNVKTVPTTEAVYNAVYNEVSNLEREMGAMADVINSIKGGGVESVDGGDYISTEGSTKTDIKLSLNVTDEIKDDNETVPTTKAVYNHITNTNSNYVHLTEKQKLGLYEPVEKIISQMKTTSTDDFMPTIGCLAFVPSEFIPTPQENVKLSSFIISKMFGPSETHPDPKHIVFCKKICIWELNNSNNTIKYKTSINTNIQAKDTDGYLIDVNLTKYVTLELGKTYFITFHGSDYKPNQVAATSQKYDFYAPAYEIYPCKSAGEGGIYYVIADANETFSYNSIDKTKTIKCTLNSSLEIEHVVTDKNIDDYVKETIINNSNELIDELNKGEINKRDVNLLKTALRQNFSTFDNPNYDSADNGKAGASGLQISREHFTTGVIDSIDIHAIGANVTTTINDIVLCAIIYNKGEDESTTKTLDDCIFSTNEVDQVTTPNQKITSTFVFDNLELPEDYEFVRLLFAKSRTVLPVPSDTNTYHSNVRVQVLKQTANNNFGESPDDDCKILMSSGGENWGEQNWYPAVSAKVYNYKSVLNRLSILEQQLATLINQ